MSRVVWCVGLDCTATGLWGDLCATRRDPKPHLVHFRHCARRLRAENNLISLRTHVPHFRVSLSELLPRARALAGCKWDNDGNDACAATDTSCVHW